MGGHLLPEKNGDAVSPRLCVDASPNGVMRKEDSAVSCMVTHLFNVHGMQFHLMKVRFTTCRLPSSRSSGKKTRMTSVIVISVSVVLISLFAN